MNAFARGLATADEKEQAEFLNEFARELVTACKARWFDQCYYMARYVNTSTLDVLRELTKQVEREHEHAEANRLRIPELREEVYQLERRKKELEGVPF